jgi:AraC-like DNA-binding protein
VTDEILYLGLAVIVFYIGFWGLKQRKIFYQFEPQLLKAEDPVVPTEDKAEKSGTVQTAEESEPDKILEPLLHIMKEEKPYLDPELSIIALSAKLNIHPHKLSKLINSQLHQNFFDFINRYRVEEFKTLAFNSDYEHYSILAIAFEAGFNSKASFNRIFKNITGNTPSQYMNDKNLHPGSDLP